MNFKTALRQLVVEDKSHLIRRNTNLKPEQKTEIIAHFKKFPHKESKIDWNQSKKLTWQDFKKEIDVVSKRQQKSKVKLQGIKGLVEKKDYLFVFEKDGIAGYIPLTHQASQLIASKSIGGVVGKWCTTTNDSSHWWRYADDSVFLIYIINYNTKKKYAIAFLKDESDIEVFNQNDRFIKNIPGINISKIVNKAKTVLGDREIQRRDGVIKEWWDDEKKKIRSQGFYKNGKLDGEFKRWYESGQLYIHSFWKNDKFDSEYKEWHENGQLDVHTFYKNGKRDGEYKGWWDNGKLSAHHFYENGELNGEYKDWDYDGTLLRHLLYKKGNIIKTYFDSNP